MNNTNSLEVVRQETLNNIMLDVLRGAKDVGSEVYGASKAGIIKAVDFAQEQAPLVVQEFCRWHFFEAICNFMICVLAIGILGYFIYRARLSYQNHQLSLEDTQVVNFVCYICIGLILIFGCGSFAKKAIKIGVAPRVYMIEYVTDALKEHHNKH